MPQKIKQFIRANRYLFLGIGTAIFGFLLWKVGISSTVRLIASMGWGSLLVLFVSVAWKFINTYVWILAFPPQEARPGFWPLFRVALAGDTISHLLPSASMGGELAKPYLLRTSHPVSHTLPSVVINKTIEVLSGLVFALLGLAVAFSYFPIDPKMRVGMILALLAGCLAFAIIYFTQHKHPLTKLSRFVERIGIKSEYLKQKREAIIRVDEGLASFYRRNKGRFIGAFVLRLVTWSLTTVETYLVLWLMSVDTSFAAVLLLTTLPLIINTAFSFVPGNIGTSEAGYTYIAHLLHLEPAAGLSLALVIRLRRLFWAGVGALLMHTHIPPNTNNVLAKHPPSNQLPGPAEKG